MTYAFSSYVAEMTSILLCHPHSLSRISLTNRFFPSQCIWKRNVSTLLYQKHDKDQQVDILLNIKKNSYSISTPVRFLFNLKNQNISYFNDYLTPVYLVEQKRFRKLKYGFGYGNYGHKKIRPPGHFVTQWFGFIFGIASAVSLVIYLTRKEFSDSYENSSQSQHIPRRPHEYQKRLDQFFDVKAATINESLKSTTEDDKKREEGNESTIYMTPADFLRSITPGLKQPDGLELDKFRKFDPREDSWEKSLNTHLSYSMKDDGQSSIFERIGGKQCLITFSDFVFLVTLLSTPARYFNIAFQMFDLDGNGNFDYDEFLKLKNLIRSQTTVGQRHRDHATTGNILKETSILNKYFFGENLDQTLSIHKFLEFYEQLQNEIIHLEFNCFTKSPVNPNNITEYAFSQALLAYSGLSDNHTKKMLKRIKKAYPIDTSIGISFDDYQNFNNFIRNIYDIDTALTFFNVAEGSFA
ncbi:unnamed protein product, partial [Didymodactylos carnosus]